MTQYGLVLLLSGALAWGQAASSAQPLSGAAATPAPAAAPQGVPPDAPSANASEKPRVTPEAAVITVDGICDKPSNDLTNADCKTVITRADFERIMNAVQPDMPESQRRQFAANYALLLVVAHEAHKEGLDQGPQFEERLKLSRMQLLMQQLGQSLRTKAAQIPDKDISDYYASHPAEYEETTVEQLYVPRPGKPAAPKAKAAGTAAAPLDPDVAAKKKAEALRARAVAGESFEKLQAESYLFAGIKDKPPETKKVMRASHMPPAHAAVMNLAPGSVSSVISDSNGYFVYKVEKKETASLESVRPEIHNVLQNQRMQASIQALQHEAVPKLDDRFFGAPTPPSGGPGASAVPASPPPNAGAPSPK